FLPSDFACECGCKSFDKEKDIMDVWFDSGVTHAAVLCERDDLSWPADLYLEGNDQYRGWFQSSLLTSVAWKGVAPYRAVFTHGMVVDGEGKKMSKSLGNGMSPLDICDEYGSDILRLWVSSLDYRTDIRISKEILKQTAENYRKIRNTARYILGNLNGFDPNKDMVAFDDLTELDKWAMYKLNDLIIRVAAAYESSEFHVVSSNIHKFCVVDMSNFYLDIIKDRLYCEEENGILRKAAQTTMYKILSVLTRMLAPVLSFTSEEIWASMPHVATDDTEAVLFNEMEKELSISPSAEFTAKWDMIYNIREDVKKALEIKRTDKEIKASLEAKVVLYCDNDELYSFVKENTNDLATIFIVSQVEAVNGADGEFKGDVEGLSVSVVKAQGDKCERCWIYSETVGTVAEHPTICARCASVLEKE
ncbi:MAG: class I tRNA ligase family protein, partial [Oscillospiraceae bacterium]|nr:class I tRNA ligase family protein [Oscillospiraceae bacterium]